MTKILVRLGLAAAAMCMLFVVAIAPFAAAADWGPLGEFTIGFNLPTIIIFTGIAAVVTGLAWGRAMIGKVPLAGKLLTAGGPILGILLLLGASWMNSGGLLNGDDSTATIFTDDGTTPTFAAGATGFDAARYEPVSAITLYAADTAAPATAVNPVASIYKAGVTDKAAMEGTAVPLHSATLSSGTATFSFNVQTYGTCIYDIGVDAANYYEKVVRNVDLCRAKNANGLNAVPVPTIFLDKIGTASLSLTATSLTCTAGTTCTYSLVVRNSVVDTKLQAVAVKFTNVDSGTLESVVTGSACEIIDVSGTLYVKYLTDLGSLESRTCNLSISRASGDTDGSFTWTMNDLFMTNGATAHNTNGNTRGAAATSATTVSFA